MPSPLVLISSPLVLNLCAYLISFCCCIFAFSFLKEDEINSVLNLWFIFSLALYIFLFPLLDKFCPALDCDLAPNEYIIGFLLWFNSFIWIPPGNPIFFLSIFIFWSNSCFSAWTSCESLLLTFKFAFCFAERGIILSLFVAKLL